MTELQKEALVIYVIFTAHSTVKRPEHASAK